MGRLDLAELDVQQERRARQLDRRRDQARDNAGSRQGWQQAQAADGVRLLRQDDRQRSRRRGRLAADAAAEGMTAGGAAASFTPMKSVSGFAPRVLRRARLPAKRPRPPAGSAGGRVVSPL